MDAAHDRHARTAAQVPPFPPHHMGPVPPRPYPPGPPPLPGPPPPGAHFAPRVRRGDVRAALLALLAEREANGYQLIQEIRGRSHGVWSPSPGSVYPALQQLEDEGLVTGEESGGSRTYRITDTGRGHVARHREDPWAEVARSLPEEMMELRMLWGQLSEAFGQLTHVANAKQVAAASRLLKTTRRSIFAILADDADEEEEEQ
ncbi:PadR family transcriptional regulator [Sphaerisporangium fuscum]|uniref:PadR family transcriptional regulator n=1 Tax=Sphaerisporangium fuscum TaxID=2835868 RepID=UPI002029996A|nr:PadR family transcriptional regulator [Sphaerisporangium fuscum]